MKEKKLWLFVGFQPTILCSPMPAPFLVLTMAPLMVRNKKKINKKSSAFVGFEPTTLRSPCSAPFLLSSPASVRLLSRVYYPFMADPGLKQTWHIYDNSVESVGKKSMAFGPKICRNLFSSTVKDDNSVKNKLRKISNSFILRKTLVSAAEKDYFRRNRGILTISAAFFLRFGGFCRQDKNAAANLEMGEKWHVRSS